MDRDERVIFSIFVILMFIVLISYIITPFCNDLKVFFAAAKLSDFFGNFPYNVTQVWEIKPIGTRIFFYSLYEIASLFANFSDKSLFEPVTKTLYAFLVFLIITISAFSLHKSIKNINFSVFWFILTLLFSMYSLSYFATLQTEDVCLLILCCSFPLAFSGYRIFNVLSGIPLSLLFVMKGITILMALYVFVILYLLGMNYRKQLLNSLSGFFLFFSIQIIFLLRFYPEFFADMFLSTELQHTIGISLISRIASVPIGFINANSHIPILVIGLLAFFSLIFYFFAIGNIRKVILIGVLWLTGLGIVFMQGKFFAYHYLVLVPPALVSVFSFTRVSQEFLEVLNDKQRRYQFIWYFASVAMVIWILILQNNISSINYFLVSSLVVFLTAILWIQRINQERFFGGQKMLILLLVFSFGVWILFQSPIGLYSERITKESGKEREVLNNLTAQFNLSSQNEILYLDSGIGAYYFSAKSHCIYFSPVSLERAVFYPNIRQTKSYRESIECIENYDGNYIVVEPSFLNFRSFPPEVQEKLMDEYRDVSNQTNPKSPLIIYQKIS